MNSTLIRAMQSGIDEGVFPGAVLFVRFHGEVMFHQAFGRMTYATDAECVTVETFFDLASLTKPLATATAILQLIQDEKIQLGQSIECYFPEYRGKVIGSATVEHLLRHSSGLPGWQPIYEQITETDRRSAGFLGSPGAKQLAVDLIGAKTLLHPIGAKSVYSDLGFILLGCLVERVTGLSLDSFCRHHLYVPNGIHEITFLPNVLDRPDVQPYAYRSMAPTENDPWRGRLLKGEVHDENAYALGGVTGHAGLFGTSGAVMSMVSVWLDGYAGRHAAFDRELVRRFVTRDKALESTWALGWDTPSTPSSSGQYLSRHAFGHLGFTGTSIWVDPTEELQIVLLTNRVHPTRDNTKIQQFRPLIHDRVYRAIVKNE